MTRFKQGLSIALVGMSALVVPAVAMASNYDITYNFDSNLTGETREFDGANIAVDLDSTYDGPYPTTNTFTVKLYRSGFWGDDYIGSGSAPSNGTKTLKWSSVGAGDYYLTMSHSPYGYYVDGSGTIYNY